MSYSFDVTATSKADAKAKIAAEFDNVVSGQPVHAADREAALNAANAFVDILADPADGEEIKVSVHGSLGWQGAESGNWTHANLGVSASRMPAMAPA